ncbi:cob(I)yrinic acid a,c-diamide adenosyltransferase [Candidatus Formimonas warabiya]|nr:cob(I)yrinic acid a,c-diamide adenosyltransferase [Candidatus Formimonas warabiya]
MKEDEKMPPVQSIQAATAERGLVMVITGNGKGKTTSAFGQALRAVGQGWKVCIIQFMKGRKYGEILAAEKYLPDLTIIQSGLDSFVMRDHPAPIDVDLAREGMEKAREVVKSEEYHMVILDEINVAVDFNLIPEEEVLDLIRNKPPKLNLILTGRYASARIKERADMVSEITEVKHHYHSGIKGRAGIEY